MSKYHQGRWSHRLTILLVSIFVAISMYKSIVISTAGNVSINLTSSYVYNLSSNFWGSLGISDNISYGIGYRFWESSLFINYSYIYGLSTVFWYSSPYIYTYLYNITGNLLYGFIYIYWYDKNTGINTCFPYRACVVRFAVPGITDNVTIIADDNRFLFNNVINGVIENSFTFIHREYSDVIIHVIPDSNISQSFNYTIPLTKETIISNTSWMLTGNLLIVKGNVVFNGYNIPAQNETVYLKINDTVAKVAYTNTYGYFYFSYHFSNKGIFNVCVSAVHGNSLCKLIQVTYSVPTAPINMTLTITVPSNIELPKPSPVFRIYKPSIGNALGFLAIAIFVAIFIVMSPVIGYLNALWITMGIVLVYGLVIRDTYLMLIGFLGIVGAPMLKYIRSE